MRNFPIDSLSKVNFALERSTIGLGSKAIYCCTYEDFEISQKESYTKSAGFGDVKTIKACSSETAYTLYTFK